MQGLPKNKSKWFLIAVLVGLLLCIRAGEGQWFYDPLLTYFKGDYQNLPLPPLDSFRYGVHLYLRYGLNSLISMSILFVVFRQREQLRFVAYLYVGLGLILGITFFLLYNSSTDAPKLLIFYVRRFLIQPLFLLLFIPAFFYQNKHR
ncbi:exosortase F system-associated membrane protein [Flavobacterium sp.]|uniref:exosortase F system-associated membrane protein n=1 Tax=Flavobacterium sp. TaxID=239 RepID=UPI0039198251